MSVDELPDVLVAEDIAKVERISRRRVYELFNLSEKNGGIANYPIGFSKRVDKADYLRWREARKAEYRNRFA